MVESLDGPVPAKREIVERQFTTYCALHLGHPRRAAPHKVELIRHFFDLVQMADETAAMQPYMRSDTVNSVCHAHHIWENITDFEHYFPEVQYYQDKLRTKYRISTSISIRSIKHKIWAELRKHKYWVDPTSIKCYETKRCGFFSYAHPIFTHRHDFTEILDPIFKSKITTGQDFEYGIQPERLNVTAGLQKLSEKVVMIRSARTHTYKVQSILTSLFSTNDDTDIKSLRK